ncbi:MAG TPA: YibE/F family protein [Candidatus Saccharibacteria bacterium]|nr:YibE/F family protein [Candidatus Saccharibacteria bacterium]
MVAIGMTWQRLGNRLRQQDWKLLGVVSVLLGVFLWYATTLTPYRNVGQDSFYEVSDANTSNYQRARIGDVSKEGVAQVTLLDGYNSGSKAEVKVEKTKSRELSAGDIVLVIEHSENGGDDVVAYVDAWRLPVLAVLLAVFIASAVAIGGRQGAMSVLGLLLSILVVGWFIVPMIISGYDALIISLIGSYIIAGTSVLISHGWRVRTFISIGCIVGIVTLVAVLAWIVTILASLSGIADEAALYLLIDNTQLDIRGVMIGGIIIASLGMLDDVVTTQVATTEELHKTDRSQSPKKLYAAASSVGGEHIASLVNTLALAYVGASLPMVILLSMQNSPSALLAFNGQYIATEVVRTLVASIGLIFSVPISTLAATMYYARRKR